MHHKNGRHSVQTEEFSVKEILVAGERPDKDTLSPAKGFILELGLLAGASYLAVEQ